MPDTHQNASIDLQLISVRNEHAHQIVAGFQGFAKVCATVSD